MSDFLTELAKSDRYEAGNFFKAGRGTLIVKDVKIFKSKKDDGDPFTYVAEFIVKSSSATVAGVEPNQPGTSVSNIQKLTKAKHTKMAKSNMMKTNLAILGPKAEAMPPAELAEALKWLLRPAGQEQPEDVRNRTIPGSPCPARGYQVAFETVRKEYKDGPKDFPEFRYVETTPEMLKENLAILAGASTSSEDSE